MNATTSDTVRVWLEMRGEVAAGDPVPITLWVENVSGRLLELHLRGRTVAFDLVVSDADGRLVWRRLHDAVIPAILRLETLPPGGRLEFADRWDQLSNEGAPVPPGAYAARGDLLTDGEPLRSPEESLLIGGG